MWVIGSLALVQGVSAREGEGRKGVEMGVGEVEGVMI